MLHNITFVTVIILGFITFFVGLGWLVSPEPWLLDQAANETLLNVSFDKLFSESININLPLYLTLSYRFFGWWILSVGLLITAYAIVTRMGTTVARFTIYFVLFIIFCGMTLIEKTFIPTSPFLYLTLGAWILWFIGIWSGIQLKKYDA
ncbi:MAG: hypothetical protein ISR89_07320 [Candidatus Marinimicrobia bacterium]|nr:hypothetical protein [Candidatus Neomarinimicrobiota bacterium]MBL7030959.1 hypothetical protein [Candidatus Neomarinimicrobiota bacterium]